MMDMDIGKRPPLEIQTFWTRKIIWVFMVSRDAFCVYLHAFYSRRNLMKRSLVFLSILLPLVVLILFLHVLTGSVAAKPQMMEVGGSLTEDSVWEAVNSPYVLTSAVHIPAGITLTVAPGVTVLSKSWGGIIVEGNIVAVGTPIEPITFTSFTDSGPGEWPGFFFWDGSGHFENAIIRFGGENVTDPIDGIPLSGTNVNIAGLAGSDGVKIRNSIIHGSNGFGMFVPVDYLHLLQLENVTFTQNITDRVQIISGAPITTDVTLSPQPGLEGYEIDKDGLIVAVGTLTLEPGTTLMNPSGSGIILQGGHLTAVGTPEKPITFTSATDSAADRWGGIFFWDGSAQFAYSSIRFAGEDVEQQAVSALHVYEVPSHKSVTLENSIIYGSGGYGIAVEVDNLHQLHMQNNQFVNNEINRVLLLPDINGGNGTLAGLVNLPGQDGLESYELLAPGLIVPDGMTMTVGAGATLMSSDGVSIRVAGGHLDVPGKEAAPVRFTSSSDNSPGGWDGIRLTEGTAEFNYAELRYAENNLTVNNTAVSTPILLQNSQLHSASNNGLLVQGGVVKAVCSAFHNNSGSGVLVGNAGNPVVEISISSLVGNMDAGLRNENVGQVDARQNWWGDAAGPAGNGPGMGDEVLGNVLFEPWLTEVTCITQPDQLYLPLVVIP
jgi:hypothetical protein